MAATDLADEIAKRKVADALNGQGDDSDPDPDTSATADTTDEAPSQGFSFTPIRPPAAVPEPLPESTTEKSTQAPAGAEFLPFIGRESYEQKALREIFPPAQDVQENVPRGTSNWYMGEEGADVSPMLTTAPVFSTPIEQGSQQYIYDESGQKIPRAQLATSEDIAAQPPGEGTQLPQETVTGEPAPDRLTQVERGELVKVPPGTAPRATLVDPDPDRKYLAAAQELEQPPGQQAQPPPPKPQAAQGFTFTPVGPAGKPAEPAAQPAPDFNDRAKQWQTAMQAYGFNARLNPDGSWVGLDAQGKEVTPEQNKGLYQFGAMLSKQYGFTGQTQAPDQLQDVPTAPAVKRAEPVTQQPTAQAQQPDVSTFKNPNGSALPVRVQAVDDKDPVAFITHHTSGRGTVAGVVSTLRERGLGVEYVMDRDGNIFQTGGAGAQNIRAGWGPKGTGLNNQNIVGMEVIAKDNNDVTDAQKQSFARFMAARYPNTPIFGHGEVNPGHKEEDEGQATKAAALAYRAQLASGVTSGATTAEASQAQPATKQSNGLYANEKPEDFLTGKVTTFATPEDIKSGADNGVGSANLGKLDTTRVAGVAIPEAALRAKYGNNYAAWRTARVDVVDPATGKRLRVPIVDVGPRGDLSAITDMTPAISNYFGGDKNLMVKLVDNAGPDVRKNPQLFADEQAAIKSGFDSSALGAGVQKIAPKQGFSFKALSADEVTQAQKDSAAATQQHTDTINKLPEADSGNIIGLYKRLDQPVDGTTAQSRAVVQANLKPQIIALMRQKFPELKTDDEAWAKATSDVNPLDVGREWITKALGYGQQFTNVMQKGVAGSDLLHVNQFIDATMPGASDADKHAYLSKLYALPLDQRIAEITSKLPQPQAGMPSTDPQQIVSALTRLSDPNFQKQQAADLAKSKAEMQRNVSSDPRLVGTGMEKVIDATAQMPSFLAAFSNPLLMPVAMAQVSDQVRETFKAQHPEWDEKTLQDKSAYATLVQFYGQEAAMKIMTVGGGALLGAVESPAKRAIAQAIASAGGTAAVGAGAQAATNIIAGESVGKGVGEAAITGAIQGGVAGAVHGVGELRRRAEAPPVRPSIEPLERPPLKPGPPEGVPEEEQVYPPAVPIAPVSRPISAEEILGGNVPDRSLPWYAPGPIVTRAAERTAFSPEELASKVSELGAQGWSPQQLRELVANLQPDPDFYRQEVYLSQEAQAALRPPAGEVPRGETDAERLYREKYGTKQQPIATPPARRLEPPTPTGAEPMPFAPPSAVGESEPWVSKIANRFTAERILNGEIGPVVPGQGVTKEEMISQGIKMGPEQINQHVSDLMNNVGDPKAQAAAIRTEEARLSQVSRNASLASEAKPADQQLRIAADNAFKDLSDFHNGPVAKLKNNWHAQGMTLQGELPVDLSTYNGLREAFLRDVGKPAPPEMEPVMRQTAKKVRDASAAEALAMQKLGAEIDRQSARRPLPTDEQVRENIMKRMKVEPCPT